MEAVQYFGDGRVHEIGGLAYASVNLPSRCSAEIPERDEDGVFELTTGQRGLLRHWTESYDARRR
jgi:hypothetical protein